MSILQKAYDYLKKISSKQESFTTVINRSLLNDNLSENEIKSLSDTLKSTVNKYYFLQYEVKSLEKEIKKEEMDILIIALSMYQFGKNITLEYLISCFNADFQYFAEQIEGFSLDLETFEDVIQKIGKEPLNVPEKYNKIPVKKIAIKFSYPEWVVKMHLKHYGFKDAFKSIASIRKSIPLVINYNPMLITSEDLNKEEFVKTKLTPSAYSYVGKNKIIQNELFIKNKIFVEDEVSQFLIETLDPRQGDDLLLIDDSKGVLALDTALRISDFGKIQVACKDIVNLNATRKIAKRFNLKSIFAFESDMKLLITHVPEKSFDRVLIMPESSSLGLVRKRPDVLLTLKREELDGLIENEKYSLLEASNYVKTNGVLLYAVNTMNKKECENVVNEFLSAHDNFVLMEDRQIFPYISPSDGVYYALMKKVSE